MFSINQSNGTISLTRGDTATMTVKVFNADGTERAMASGDTLTFKMKKGSTSTSTASLTLTATDNTFNFAPSDTSSLTFGSYVYDIQLTTEAGDVFTITPLSAFNLMEEVC